MPQTGFVPDSDFIPDPEPGSPEDRRAAGYSGVPEVIARPLDYLRSLSRTGQKEQAKHPTTTFDKILEFARPVTQAYPVKVGFDVAKSLKGMPTAVQALGGAAAGGSALIGLDTLLQQLHSESSGLRPETPEESLSNTAAQLGVNTGITEGGRAIGQGARAVGRGIKEFVQPGSVLKDKFAELSPTMSQWLREKGSNMPADIMGWLENTFSPKGLSKRQVESQGLGASKLEQLADAIKSSEPNTPSLSNIENPQSTANAVQSLARLNNARIRDESNAKAVAAKTIAYARPVLVPSQAPPSLTTPGPEQVLVNGQWNRVVRGPIEANSAVPTAYEYLKNRQEFWGDLTRASGNEKEMIEQAQGLLKRTEALPNGRHLPMSFEEAWDAKQKLGELAYASGKETHQEGLIGKLQRALDNDIENGIKKWPARGMSDPSTVNQAALEAYRSAKETVTLRHAIFGKEGIQDLVRENGSPLQLVNQKIRDPKELQKMLDTGYIEVPNPSGGKGGPLAPQKILATNMRQELGGHELERILQDTRRVSPMNPNRVEIDINKMQQQLNDPTMQDSYGKLWSNQTRGNIDQLFKQLAITQEKAGGSPSRMRVYMHYGGLAIPAALLTGHMTNYGVGAAIGSTAALGGFALARAMQNPRIARSLIALAAGQPAGISDMALGRALVGALQGTGAVVDMIGKDGESNQGTIGKDYSWQPK